MHLAFGSHSQSSEPHYRPCCTGEQNLCQHCIWLLGPTPNQVNHITALCDHRGDNLQMACTLLKWLLYSVPQSEVTCSWWVFLSVCCCCVFLLVMILLACLNYWAWLT